MEMAAEFMLVQLRRYGVVDPNINVYIASDIEDRAFAALLCPQKNRRPLHTFRSVMHRVDATIRYTLTCI